MAIDAGSIYSEVRIKLDKLDKDLATVDAKFNVLKRDNEKLATDTSSSWTKSFSTIKLAGVAAVAALTASMKAAIKIGAQFGQSIANVGSVTSGTAQDLEDLREAAKKAGETTRFTASQAADALYSLASAGLSAKESISALDGVLEFAGATQSDLATSSALVVSTLKQYGLEATEANKVSNILAAGIGNSLATMDKFRLALMQVGPVAGAMNISLEDTTGALQALFDAGFKGETAGRALKNIYADLADEGSIVNKELSKLGFSFDELNPATNDFVDIIDTLNSKGLTAGQVIGAFGKESGPQIVALMSAGGKAIQEYTDAVTGTTAAADMYAQQNDTLAGSFDKMKSALQGVAILITEKLTPSLREILDVITRVANKITGSTQDSVSSFNDLEKAVKDYNSAIENAEDKTDALTQAMVAQAKAALNLALQKAGDAYADSNKNVEEYNKTIESSTNWINKLTAEQNALAEGTGYTADELNRMAATERSKILLDEKGQKAVIAYNQAYEKRVFYTQKQTDATVALGKAEADQEVFINTLTKGYIENNDVTKLLLDSYPELKQAVMNNVDAYNAQIEAEKQAIESAKKEYENYSNNENLRTKASQSYINLANAKIKMAKSSEEAKIWQNLLALATEDLTQKEENAVKTADELAQKDSKRKEILETLNNSIIESNMLEATLGDSYDQNAELSSIYLKAIEDLLKNGEDPQSDKLKELVALYKSVEGATKDVTKSVEDNYDAIISQANAYEEIKGYYRSDREAFIANLHSKAEEFWKAGVDIVDIAKWQADQIAKYDEETAKKTAETIKQAQEETVQAVSSALSSISSMFSAIASARLEQIDAELQAELEKNGLIEESTLERLNNEKQATEENNLAELEAIDKQIEMAKLAGDAESEAILMKNRAQLLADQEAVRSEQDKAIKKQEITEEYEQKKRETQYKYELLAWSSNLASALVDNASAILKTMSAYPYPWNVALATAQGIAGGAQVATVVANKPKLATGGVVLPQSGGVETIQAENGFGELSLNAGPSGEALLNNFASRIAEQLSSSQGSNGKQIVINYIVESEVITKMVVDDINNGKYRLE